MRPSRIAAIVLRQFYLVRGSLVRIIPTFVWVAIDIVLWGFITRYLTNVTSGGINFTGSLLGAVLLWGLFVRVMHGTSMAFMEDVWSRNFLNLFATPLNVPEYLTGLTIAGVLSSLIGLAAMLILAILVFGFSLFAYGLALIPFLLTLFLFGIALGILGCAIMLRLGPSSEWFIWPIPAFIAPFAGVFYPLSVLPHWMQMVAKILPPSYIFEGMRAIVQGRDASPAQLACGVTLALVYVFLAGWVFARVYRHALRTGLIARYSAESIS